MKISLTPFFLALFISKALGENPPPYGGIDCASEGIIPTIGEGTKNYLLLKAGCSCDFDIRLTFGKQYGIQNILVQRDDDPDIDYFIPDADPTVVVEPINPTTLKFTYEGQGWVGYFYTDQGLGQWKTPFLMHRNGCTLVDRVQEVMCYTDETFTELCDCSECSYDYYTSGPAKLLSVQPEAGGECINVCQELS